MKPLSLLVAVVAMATTCLAPASNASAENIIGLGATQAPRYLGSAEDRIHPVPLVSYAGDRFLANTLRGVPELGIFITRGDRFELAAIASVDRGRKASDSPLLSEFDGEDIDPYASIGIVASHERRFGPLPFDVLVRPLRRLGDSDGWLVDMRVALGVAQTRNLSAQLHGQLTWADATAQAVDFELPGSLGVLAPNTYRGSSGVRERRYGLSAEYRLGARSRLLAQWENRELASNLRASPLVDDRRATAVTVGLAFKF